MPQVHCQRIKYVQLGKPNWIDPDRKRSIKNDPRVKMKWRIKDGTRRKKCWIALLPASDPVGNAIEKIESALYERNHDFFDGIVTDTGCSYDPTMFGLSVEDAQPTVVFSSDSEKCRQNAKNIITDKGILVDPRGIGMEYYGRGPQFYTGTETGNYRGQTGDSDPKMLDKKQPPHSSSDNRMQDVASSPSVVAVPFSKQAINKELVMIGRVNCTIGGIIAIDDQLFGLTVAHAFESSIQQDVGELSEKRNSLPTSQRNLDWALCKLDFSKVRATSAIVLPDGFKLYPAQIALEIDEDIEVWVQTGTTGVLKGMLLHSHSLVALPGHKRFQRMWIVNLDRIVLAGDCGSWVLDEKGTLYGQIVAAKPETRLAYILLARDIFRDIRDQFGGRHVRVARESDFVSTLTSIKRDLSSPRAKLIRAPHMFAESRQSGARSPVSDTVSSHFIRSSDISWPKRLQRRPEALSRNIESQGVDFELRQIASIDIAKQRLLELLEIWHSDDRTIQQARDWYVNYLDAACFADTSKLLLPAQKGFSDLVLQPHQYRTNKIIEEERRQALEIFYPFLYYVAQIFMKPRGRTLKNIAAELRHRGIFLTTAEPALPGLITVYMSHLRTFTTLKSITGVKVEWTDQLPQHLQFDLVSRTLTLFSLPSFAHLIYSRNSILAGMMDDLRITQNEQQDTVNISPFTADNLLREVLLSYRLIFGVSSSSWREFRRVNSQGEMCQIEGNPPPDPLLGILCGQKWTSSVPKAIYHQLNANPLSSTYASEFPLLGKRLYDLHEFVQRQQPNTLRDLWFDRRDITKWYTLWALVTYFCIITVLLVTQTIISVVQLKITLDRSNLIRV
ncbi:hypothetical protein PVAG01_06799 [Phlyctema vagabunda]|uniref:Uncharacterized protein n=1 Tax=Phlyctema vagabunda TaxID=108571 RepID=A0ABR4PH48_9HELO